MQERGKETGYTGDGEEREKGICLWHWKHTSSLSSNYRKGGLSSLVIMGKKNTSMFLFCCWNFPSDGLYFLNKACGKGITGKLKGTRNTCNQLWKRIKQSLSKLGKNFLEKNKKISGHCWHRRRSLDIVAWQHKVVINKFIKA